ncbi:RNA-binding protein [Flavivirga aquatica]|uniref:RNA-binding protein n=1 Tax=Flavivirga aquatica TaxID=1849968 RepID=A0A1E5TBQ6_9FLAO|nr:VCBS repeat-containing protein [Flavivirga aquatica]OEK08805.1 RNA-binding protein [Flavivirga aquatica]
MTIINYKSCIFFILILVFNCKKSNTNDSIVKLFSNIPSSYSQVDFKNELIENENFHYYQYIYAYNGGGVAVADFNNDALEDLFFISNTKKNKLYLNKGNLVFDDITEQSKIIKRPGFDTGVSIVDINNDGFLDIYICRAGWYKEDDIYANMLFINNGDLTFSEKAEEYGLADKNRSTNATFFDFDNDGDLDVYVVNTPNATKGDQNIIDLKQVKFNKKNNTSKGSDKLYQNNGNGKFIDISTKAGIKPEIAFGLNAQIGDLNNDGWLDIYVSNDFNMPDFTYINNKNGTFSDKSHDLYKHISFYSMGADVADINNDGAYDVLTLDMSPEDYIRSKTTMSMTSNEKFEKMVKNGYHYQYMHNNLQLNNQNGTFSEIANMAGVAKTDWSWSPLLADFDLDGYNDVYITNGIYRDVLDKDTNNAILKTIRAKGKKPNSKEFLKYTQMLPQEKMTNYFFKNNGDLTFTKISDAWSNMKPTFSNGAVYSDLDNDGDLEIITNNINDEATILKNNATELNKGNFLQFQFKGSTNNKFAVGTKVNLHFENGKIQTRQLINSRGYLSSITNKLHFGLGDKKKIKKVTIIWPDGKFQQLKDIASNQVITVNYSEAKPALVQNKDKKTIFKETVFNYKHTDSVFNDYNIQLLLPHKLSQLGPAIAKCDLNKDGLDDLYLGGGFSQSGQLLIANSLGTYTKITIPDFESDRVYEDISASFFDFDNDGDKDLYVVSGSYEFYPQAPELQDRIYINNGNGILKKCTTCVPKFSTSGSIVSPADYDGDGDIDLFVGGRVIPGKYPYAPKSHLLINENGTLKIKTQSLAPKLELIGMVTDAKWTDIDQDNDLDLIVTGEWMGIEVFTNDNGKLIPLEKYNHLSKIKGWWNKLLIEDIDNDGDKDIVAGNLGLNYNHKASIEKPFKIYVNDFDFNGTQDILLAKYYKGKEVPVRGKSCTAQQIPALANKIKSYQEFANKDLSSIIGSALKTAINYEVNQFKSGIFLNNGKNKFSFSPFPMEAQKSIINSILFDDFNNDGIKDLLLAGNNHQSEIETTRADAGIGALLLGQPNGAFSYLPNAKSGFYADKDVRNIIKVKTAFGNKIIVINNNSIHNAFTFSNK